MTDAEQLSEPTPVKSTHILYMERGLTMVAHSMVIGLILYLLMVFGLGQNPAVAENRSVVLASLVLIYMVVFGHGLPVKINRML